jgi:hypothetical protein
VAKSRAGADQKLQIVFALRKRDSAAAATSASRWKKDTFLDEHFAKFDAEGVVYSEHGDGNTPSRRAAQEVGAFPRAPQ